MPFLLAILLPLAGCVEEPAERAIEGETDGYTPTGSFLKVHVARPGSADLLLTFDRRDWHTAEIARRVDVRELERVSVVARPRAIMGEYEPVRVLAPEGLEALRYDAMGASAEQRAEMDAAHDGLLEAFLARAAGPEHEGLPRCDAVVARDLCVPS